jgi:penicillin-binding protein 1B
MQDTESAESVIAAPLEEKSVFESSWRARIPDAIKYGTAFVALTVAAVVLLLGFSYAKYAKLTDRTLKAGVFANTVNVYAAPEHVRTGDEGSPGELIEDLRRSGYSESPGNRTGWFRLSGTSVEVHPGPDSYFQQEPVRISFAKNKVSSIVAVRSGSIVQVYRLEPRLITNVAENRERRTLVRFAQIPKVLIDAVVSVEDKRFFQHNGLDLFRVLKAAYVDLKEGRKEQGASTLSMQLARGLWLEPDKKWKRKYAELLITLHLESKLSKQQILEYYCNQVYLGRRGTFNIHGFGEAARVFFDKDISRLNLPEAALLAGLIQRPSYYNPFRYPERAKQRRDLVLQLMRTTRRITEEQYAQAVAAPVQLSPGANETMEAQYFVDLVNEELQNRQLEENQANASRVYTTLDLQLQRAATEAVSAGMENVDKQLRRLAKRKKQPIKEAQVALVALDPHTGEIKALVGGRNYGASQLNHVLAQRQPGSVFKPFVYAAALNTALTGGENIITAASTVVDEPTTFWFNDQPYEPGNFHDGYHGTVTVRDALAKSMNIATIKVAEMVGYGDVVKLARSCGLNDRIEATPSVALGSYEATPLEIAGAYTVFANGGVYVRPSLVSSVKSREGRVMYTNESERHAALDPRVAYLMVNLMQEVMRSGTAAGVRSRGFTAPAAGKTGTSRDGWFAGFTSNLLAIVWVGFDDNTELPLEGAKSALPIWTEFMKRATAHGEYRDTKPFQAPRGIVSARIDPESGMLASEYCPDSRVEFFIAGSEPQTQCPLHSSYGFPATAGDADRTEGQASYAVSQ